MIDIMNWIASDSKHFVGTLLFAWCIFTCIAIPIKAWRQPDE